MTSVISRRFLLLVLIAGFASLAFAETVSECQALIANLKAETQGVVITGQNAETKDRPGLIAKLDAASLALDRGKFCDAIQKLNDFKTKINQLILAGSINQDLTQARQDNSCSQTRIRQLTASAISPRRPVSRALEVGSFPVRD
jgi:hypothetical protein